MADAKISPQLAQKLYEITPCAIHLYIWLLNQAEAGEEQEVFLDKFIADAPYSPRAVQRAFSSLVEQGHVEIVRRYTSKIFELIAHDGSTQDLDERGEANEEHRQR